MIAQKRNWKPGSFPINSPFLCYRMIDIGPITSQSSFTLNDLIYSQRKTIASHARFIAKALVGDLTINRFGSGFDLNFFPIQKSDFDVDKIVASQTTCDYCVHFRLHSCADTFLPLIMIYGLHCSLQIRRYTLATRFLRPQSQNPILIRQLFW